MLYRLLLLMFILPSFAMAAATYETAHIERHGNSYEVLADYPQFKNPNAQEQKANKSIKRFVHSLFDKDLKGFVASKWSKEEIRESANPDSIEISFNIVFWDENRVSIYFEKYYFGMFAAHPVHNSYGFNYDIKNNKVIKLADLFKPGTTYLKQISDYCIKDLEGRDKGGELTGWIKDGASPKIKNLGEFTFNKNILTIYFSDYQVASGMTGLQKVEIPIEKLSGWKKGFDDQARFGY